MPTPMERAQELEAEISDRRAELDALYAELAPDPDDFAWQMAERFRQERDDARTQLAAFMARLESGGGEWEARLRAAESRWLLMRSAIAEITNAPLMPRDQVQSRLLTVYERVRDFEL